MRLEATCTSECKQRVNINGGMVWHIPFKERVDYSFQLFFISASYRQTKFISVAWIMDSVGYYVRPVLSYIMYSLAM